MIYFVSLMIHDVPSNEDSLGGAIRRASIPTIERFDWGRLVVNANDHNPPHVHIMTADGSEYRINLLSNEYMDTQRPRRRLRREIERAYRENIRAIWSEWERLHPG